MASPHAVAITLSATDRATLENWTRRRKTAQGLAMRARIILACAEAGARNDAVAEALGVSRPTVATWRKRFAERGPDGLLDEPRPGAPRRISDEQIERAVVTTLESTPANATHWSTRSLAQAVGLSQSGVVRIWHAFGLQPHRSETFKLSRDPLFVEGARHCRAVSEPARPGAGVGCRRKATDPGYRRNRASAADAPGSGGASYS